MLSLYNNKLNGILADEMGLGKTVQVKFSVLPALGERGWGGVGGEGFPNSTYQLNLWRFVIFCGEVFDSYTRLD